MYKPNMLDDGYPKSLLYMPWHILYVCTWVSSDIHRVDISV